MKQTDKSWRAPMQGDFLFDQWGNPAGMIDDVSGNQIVLSRSGTMSEQSQNVSRGIDITETKQDEFGHAWFKIVPRGLNTHPRSNGKELPWE